MTIARDWNVRGVPGATERPWTAPTLRKALLSARVAGLREHGTDPSGKVLGAMTPAAWGRAIDRQPVDELVARRVLDLLSTPAFRQALLSQSAMD